MHLAHMARMFGTLMMACAASFACADGKVFAREGIVATIPDQRALIHFKDGVETLVIETRFESNGSPSGGQESNGESAEGSSSGGEFAWVVPVPSVPELIDVTPGLMPTVQAVFEPRVIGKGEGGVLAIAALSVFVACFICLCMKSWAKGILALVFLLLAGVLLLPALGKSRGISGGGESGVTLHDRRLIGHMDVAVLSAATSESLLSWLTTNGFVVAQETMPAINEYVRDGWSFCAARLNPAVRGDSGTNEAALSSPHPLGMRFPVATPVYPLRLTATATESLSVDLYICGEARASSPGFKTVRCGRIVTEERPPDRGWRDPEPTDGLIHISHSGLRAIVGDATVGTKLSATLTPEKMATDATISWEPYASKGEAVHSQQGMLDRALVLGAGTLILGSLSSLVIAAFGCFDHDRSSKLIAGALVASVLVGLIVGIGTSTVPTFVRDGRPITIVHYDIRQLFMIEWQERWKAQSPPRAVPSLEESRAMLREVCRQYESEYEQVPPREEDSPGNYTLRETADGIEYVWYDRKGAERSELVVFPLADPAREEVEPAPGPERTPNPSGP